MISNPFPPPSPGYAKKILNNYCFWPQGSVCDILSDRVNRLSASRCIVNVVAMPKMGKTIALHQWVARKSSDLKLLLVYVSLAPLAWVNPYVDSRGCNAYIEKFFTLCTENLAAAELTGLRVPKVTGGANIEDICKNFYTSLSEILGDRTLCVILDEFHVVRPNLIAPDFKKAVFWPLLEPDSGVKMVYVVADRSPLDSATIAADKIENVPIGKLLFFGHENIRRYLMREGELTWWPDIAAMDRPDVFTEVYRQTSGHPALVSWIGFLAYKRYIQSGRLRFSDEIRQAMFPYLKQLWEQYKETLNLTCDHLAVLERLTNADGAAWQEAVGDAESTMKELKIKDLVTRDPSLGFLCMKIPLLGDVLRRWNV